ncbi:kinesin-like protein KIF15 [Morus notabilis]|uniref:kinesin-like protein KIF15 n=1 Tax=Morus notabilis TaxID=981085 RepID=UPI000CED2325|nr:kinesin-like protein KIF15 [Morus notabilis]
MILWQSTEKLLHSTWLLTEATHVRSSWRYIFHLMGAPLVENCMTCFNISIFAYGQTGCGKDLYDAGSSQHIVGLKAFLSINKLFVELLSIGAKEEC